MIGTKTYVCFNCYISKRVIPWYKPCCSKCNKKMVLLRSNQKPPRKNAKKAWKKLEIEIIKENRRRYRSKFYGWGFSIKKELLAKFGIVFERNE